MIESMPILFGEQFYPAGIPIAAEKVSVDGKSVLDWFSTPSDEHNGEHGVDIVNDYYRYYLLAPCWNLGEISPERIMAADGDELFEICMELGLDPL